MAVEQEPRNLEGILSQYGTSFTVRQEGPYHFPIIDIELPGQPGLRKKIKCVETDCSSMMSLRRELLEYPFENRGVIISFRNELVYCCEGCHMEISPQGDTHGNIIGKTLKFVNTRFDEFGIRRKSPSVDQIRAALK